MSIDIQKKLRTKFRIVLNDCIGQIQLQLNGQYGYTIIRATDEKNKIDEKLSFLSKTLQNFHLALAAPNPDNSYNFKWIDDLIHSVNTNEPSHVKLRNLILKSKATNKPIYLFRVNKSHYKRLPQPSSNISLRDVKKSFHFESMQGLYSKLIPMNGSVQSPKQQEILKNQTGIIYLVFLPSTDKERATEAVEIEKDGISISTDIETVEVVEETVSEEIQNNMRINDSGESEQDGFNSMLKLYCGQTGQSFQKRYAGSKYGELAEKFGVSLEVLLASAYVVIYQLPAFGLPRQAIDVATIKQFILPEGCEYVNTLGV